LFLESYRASVTLQGLRNVKGRDNLGDLGIDRRMMMLKWILKEIECQVVD
jgi:hypothetical protein